MFLTKKSQISEIFPIKVHFRHKTINIWIINTVMKLNEPVRENG